MGARDVRGRLEALGVRPRKGRGQNFLIDERIAERAVHFAEVDPHDIVLEIGPGLGVLTSRISEKAGKVIAIETEGRFLGLVKKSNVEYIHGDALKVDLPKFDKVVSNLPYSISTPVTFRLLEPGIDFKVAVMMYQLEFAERMGAGPGTKDYGRLSVSTYVRADVSILEKVPPTAFYPQPKVDSCLVKLVPRPPPFKTKDWALFHRVVKVAFAQRRKKLRNSVKNGLKELSVGQTDLEDLPYGDERPEELSPEQLGEVADFLCG